MLGQFAMYHAKHMATDMFGLKKRELPSACNHTRAVAMYTAKRMATDSLGVGEEAGVWARWQTAHTPALVRD